MKFFHEWFGCLTPQAAGATGSFFGFAYISTVDGYETRTVRVGIVYGWGFVGVQWKKPCA